MAVTHNPDAKLTEAADYVLVHSFFTSYATKAAKTKVVLEFSAEMLNAVEATIITMPYRQHLRELMM